MTYWLELALASMLVVATLCAIGQVYYVWVAALLVRRLATDAVQLKLLVSLAASDLARNGVLVMTEEVPQATASQKAKMN